MKTVFSKQEGVKMNSDLDFGDTKDIQDEFQYFMTTLENIWEMEFKYYFRITDDQYIQLASTYENDELNIIAQYKLRYKNLKQNILFIVNQNIEARRLYEGLPKYVSSSIFSKVEFDGIIKSRRDEISTVKEQAELKATGLIQYLRENNLYPKPSGNNVFSWMAKCPSGHNHFIMVSTYDDTWGCGYCNRKGKQPELEQWLQEIRLNEDQKHLSQMMKELKKSGSIQSYNILQWWMNRY